MPHDPETGLLIISTHDLTRRSTKSNASTILNGVNFNSRSHKEVDFHARRCVLCRICISTHDLTKRSTKPALIGIPPFARFNSRPHEEVDAMRIKYTKETISFQLTTSRRGRLISLDSDVISMAFQLTTSRRGRHRKGLLSRGGCCFNSRPHEEVDCCWKM